MPAGSFGANDGWPGRTQLVVDVRRDQRADLERALADPQVWQFVLTVGQLLRKDAHEGSLLRYIENALYTWRRADPPNPRKPWHG